MKLFHKDFKNPKEKKIFYGGTTSFHSPILTTTSHELQSLPLGVKHILKECDDLFLKEVPHRLSPLRGIKHQIDRV